MATLPLDHVRPENRATPLSPPLFRYAPQLRSQRRNTAARVGWGQDCTPRRGQHRMPLDRIEADCRMHEEQRWCVGIDWASQEHVVSLLDYGGRKIGERKVAHGGAGLAEMIAWLLKASGGEPGEIHVAIETPHGPIVEALLERGFNVYSINPKQLDRFRDRFA